MHLNFNEILLFQPNMMETYYLCIVGKYLDDDYVCFHLSYGNEYSQMNFFCCMQFLGTPVDCVSLALSGALFSWSKPLLVCFVMSLTIGIFF